MQFIRIFWGDFNRYENQIIEAKKDNLGEKVFVWGYDNYTKLKELGYDCDLINMQPYDYSIANGHTFDHHKSLIHKIKGIDIAMETYSEILFLDWDVRKVKDIDETFYKLIRERHCDLQVPLYTYPKKAFSYMLNTIQEEKMQKFFKKLKLFVDRYSYRRYDNYILPNTGFFYCCDKTIVEDLLDIIEMNKLETIPDELSVFIFSNADLNSYIKNYEPLVIGAKQHGYDWWNEEENDLEKYKLNTLKKQIYFEHI